MTKNKELEPGPFGWLRAGPEGPHHPTAALSAAASFCLPRVKARRHSSRRGIPARRQSLARRQSAQGGDLRVEASQRSAQQLGITLAVAPLHLLKHQLARKLEVGFLHLELHFFGRAGAGFAEGGFGIRLFYLSFYRFTFPTTCHASIIAPRG